MSVVLAPPCDSCGLLALRSQLACQRLIVGCASVATTPADSEESNG